MPTPKYDRANTFATLVDYYLDHDIGRLYAQLADPAEETTIKVSYQDYAQAAHRFAKWIQPSVRPGEVVAFLPQGDTLSGVTAVAGVVRLGATIFPISPRISPEAIYHLVKITSCHRMLIVGSNPVVDAVRRLLADEKYAMEFLELPPLEKFYPSLGAATPAQEQKFERLPLPDPNAYARGVVIYMHTSGSTSLPKPIGWTHEYIHLTVHIEGVRVPSRTENAIIGTQCLPLFHTMGVLSNNMIAPLAGASIVIFAPSYQGLPTPDATLRTLRAAKANFVWVVPVFLELWAASDEAVDYLKSAAMVGFGGGPLSDELGDNLVARGVKLTSMYGGTEMNAMCQCLPVGPQEWAWLRFSDAAKPRWIDQGDGTYELQFLTCETHKPAVENLPDTRGYATKDLFIQHPTKPDLWKIVGRLDDVLVLSNGEKVMPVDTESLLRGHPLIGCALVFGRAEEQVGLLLEPRKPIADDDAEGRAKFIDAVWPAVQETNEKAPIFARIMKEMILVTSPSKVMATAAKGTVIRSQTTRAYEKEIKALYASGGSSAAFPSSETWSSQDLASWLAGLIKSVGEGKHTVQDTDDLFDAGFDSLAATALRTRIVSALRNSPVEAARQAAGAIPHDFIYANPSPKSLQAALESRLRFGAEAADDSGIDSMVRQYTQLWPSSVVVVTGTTGNLGGVLLSMLVQDERVRRVYAINRPSSRTGADGHAALFEERGLDKSLVASPKVVFLEAQLHHEHLGLGEKVYDELVASVTHVFHLAWRLDFNLKLASFENNVRGTRRLLDLALASRARVRFLFASSVAVATSWPVAQGPYPEEPVTDTATASGASGYGQSKYVAEQLILDAAARGLETCSIRIGQITGSRTGGAWATSDWVPIFVKTGIALGALPSSATEASWVPMDVVAQSLSEIGFAPAGMRAAHNIVHPHPVSWDHAFKLLADALVSRGIVAKPLPLVPLKEWHSRLEAKLASAGNAAAEDELPGGKLLSFIGALASGESSDGLANLSFATSAAEAAAPTLKSVELLGAPDAEAWIDYWVRAKFLSKRV